MKHNIAPDSKSLLFDKSGFIYYSITVTILLIVIVALSAGDSYQIEGVETDLSQSTNTSSVSEFYAKGNSAYDLGRYEEAITYFDKVLALDPYDADTLYYKGISLESLGKHEEAITYFDKVLALDPYDADTLTYKGISLESLGKHAEAITYFDKVLALDPNNANTLSWKGYSLNNMGKYDDATTNLDKVSEIDSSNGNATELKAKTEISNSLAQAPSDIDLAGQATSIITNDEEFDDDAKDRAKGVIKYILNTIFPQTGEKFSNTNYGVDMTFPKNWTGFEMKIIFPMAIVSPSGFNITSLFSTYIDSSLDNIAESIVSNNKTELSEQEFRELIEPKVRESAESLSQNVMEYMENKTTSMSILIYDKELVRFISSVNPNITMSADSLTTLYERLVAASNSTFSCDRISLNQTVLNDNISAEVSTERCLPTDNSIYQNNLNYFILTPKALVDIQYSSDLNRENDGYLSEFKESLKSLSIRESLPINNQTLEQFLEHDTNNNNDSSIVSDKVQNILDVFSGNELLSQGKYEEAISLYETKLNVNPKDVDALYNKGVALHYLGRYDEAISSYDKVLALDPKYVNAIYSKGEALSQLGKQEEANIWYDNALAVDPKNVNALTSKGIELGKLNRTEEALNWFDKALEIDPEYVDALNNKGISFAVLGKYEEALNWFDKALQVDPKDVRALTLKGSVLNDLGKKTEALTWIDKALAIDPNNQMAIDAKSRVQG